MEQNNKKGEAALRLLPLSISIASCAVIVQQAYIARRYLTADDSLMPPLSDFISPATRILLAAGFLLSALALIAPLILRRWSPSMRRPCRPADRPDYKASPDTGSSSASC